MVAAIFKGHQLLQNSSSHGVVHDICIVYSIGPAMEPMYSNMQTKAFINNSESAAQQQSVVSNALALIRHLRLYKSLSESTSSLWQCRTSFHNY